MDIIFYAGSLRPGGGLTVAKVMIEALAEDPARKVLVYTGAEDASQNLKSVFTEYKNVQEKRFFPKLSSEIRYFLSKIYFLPVSLLNKNALLISVNYYIPSFYRQLVYHLNLLSFLRQESDSLSKKIKEFDAKLACKYAEINVFESNYLKKAAEKYTKLNIKNPHVLYVGVDPVFYSHVEDDKNNNPNILLVSSMQAHKDNEVCIKSIVNLVKARPEVHWVLNIAGGQSEAQWKPLEAYSCSLGVGGNVNFLGSLDKGKLSSLMRDSLCLISASKVESFCMVALEGMAARCPAIVTNETSMPESVGNAALIVDAGSDEQFSEAVLQIYDNKDLRDCLIEEGIKRAGKFSYKLFSEDLIKLVSTRSY